jgi:signal transduction histidine kinase
MIEPPIPSNENERMELIHQLDILDSLSEEVYDGIVYVASLVTGTPQSTITIVDKDRQWFKAIVGGTGKENPRAYSFCAHTILGDELLEVPDSQKDIRFKDNPLVIGKPYVRYYAGYPLELKDGLKVGTLCVIDHKPNKLTDEQLKALHYLSLQATYLLDLRLKMREIETLRDNDATVVNMLTHELRNPLTSISGFLTLLGRPENKSLSPEDSNLVQRCLMNSDRMLHTVNEFLNYSHWKDGFWSLQKEKGDINRCIQEAVNLAKGYAEKCHVSLELKLDKNLPEVEFDYSNIVNVLENLISNAAKYSKEGGKIVISSHLDKSAIKVQVQDFGAGIPAKDQNKIFKPFEYTSVNKAGIKGSGLGLSVAKKIVNKHGGELDFVSIENQGTTFYFTIPVS